MKKILLTLFLITFTASFSQKSPSVTTNGIVDGSKIAIEYSSPKVKGRVIYGDLVPFGEIWRAGANKNTIIHFSSNVKINNKPLKAGKYGFFIIPNENNEWIAVFSNTIDSWGSYKYNKKNDALRITVKANTLKEAQEDLLYKVTSDGINFAWAEKSIDLEVKLD